MNGNHRYKKKIKNKKTRKGDNLFNLKINKKNK